MQPSSLAGLLVSCFLAGCQSTLGRAPGPETAELASAARGTLIVMPAGGGDLSRTVRLIDLPSVRERRLRLEHDPVAIGGLDDQGQFVYAYDVDAGVTLLELASYPFEDEPQRPAHFERWRARAVDVGSGVERDLGTLEGFPKCLALAPSGGALIAVNEPAAPSADAQARPSEVWCIDLASGVRRKVTHQVGRVVRCDWKPDGSAFALTGSAGGELIDAATLASSQVRSGGFGPFTLDGGAYLRRSGERHELVALDRDDMLVGDARLLWPATRGPAHERGQVEPIGLCGERLALYEALPTKGQQVESSFARGGYLRFEHPAIKVADVESGTYATVLAGNESPWRPRFSPVRLELPQH